MRNGGLGDVDDLKIRFSSLIKIALKIYHYGKICYKFYVRYYMRFKVIYKR